MVLIPPAAMSTDGPSSLCNEHQGSAPAGPRLFAQFAASLLRNKLRRIPTFPPDPLTKLSCLVKLRGRALGPSKLRRESGPRLGGGDSGRVSES